MQSCCSAVSGPLIRKQTNGADVREQLPMTSRTVSFCHIFLVLRVDSVVAQPISVTLHTVYSHSKSLRGEYWTRQTTAESRIYVR